MFFRPQAQKALFLDDRLLPIYRQALLLKSDAFVPGMSV